MNIKIGSFYVVRKDHGGRFLLVRVDSIFKALVCLKIRTHFEVTEMAEHVFSGGALAWSPLEPRKTIIKSKVKFRRESGEKGEVIK